jgi:hypothetical protein
LNWLAFEIGSLALSLLVYRRTGSALAAALYFLASQFLPALVSPWFVARLDQRGVRGVLALLHGLEALVFLALAALASSFALVPVVAVALLDGLLAVTAQALARTASVSVTAPLGLLREGNALSNGAYAVVFMTGPAIGGLLVAGAGTVTALLVVAGLFAAMSLILGSTTSLPRAVSEPSPSRGRLRAALSYAARRPAIRVLIALQAAAVLFFAISIPVEVVFATHTLHSGAGGLGALTALWGAGAVAGSAVYARFRALPARVLISLGAGALAVGFAVMAAAPSLGVALVGAAVAGAGNGIEAVSARTALQENVDEHWMAMMMSLDELIQQAFPGVGIVLGGLITALANARVALAVAGVGAAMITAVAWSVLSPRPARRALRIRPACSWPSATPGSCWRSTRSAPSPGSGGSWPPAT